MIEKSWAQQRHPVPGIFRNQMVPSGLRGREEVSVRLALKVGFYRLWECVSLIKAQLEDRYL